MSEVSLNQVSREIYELIEKHNLDYWEGLAVLEATKGYMFFQINLKELKEMGKL